jgi:hypothetical protein
MNSNRRRKENDVPTQGPTPDQLFEARRLQAWLQCERLISFLDTQAIEQRSLAAVHFLENAAAHLERLADYPFPVPIPRPPALYNWHAKYRRPRSRSESSGHDIVRIETPTPAQLQALYDLPSDRGGGEIPLAPKN